MLNKLNHVCGVSLGGVGGTSLTPGRLLKITTLILAVLCVLTAWPVSACGQLSSIGVIADIPDVYLQERIVSFIGWEGPPGMATMTGKLVVDLHGKVISDNRKFVDFSRPEGYLKHVGVPAGYIWDTTYAVGLPTPIGWEGPTDIYDSVKCGDGWLYMRDGFELNTIGEHVVTITPYFRMSSSPPDTVLHEKPCIITETPPSVTVLPVDTLRQYPVVDTVGWRISIYGNTYKCGRFDCIDAPFDCKVFPTLDTTWHDKVQVWLTPEEKEDYDKWKRMRIVRKWGCIAPMDKAEVKR